MYVRHNVFGYKQLKLQLPKSTDIKHFKCSQGKIQQYKSTT